MNWKLMEIIETAGATPATSPDHSLILRGISTDTRTLRKGELFVALKGVRYDGHQFVKEAVSKGAAAILAQDPTPIVQGIPHLFVPDTLRAYGKIAAAYRRKLKARFIAITGSMGKTTVKEMAHAILSKKYKAAKTEKNENNQVGVPKTILGIPPDSDVAVIEMGSNIPGEIALLTEIVQPDKALVTNIAPVHLERFVSLEGVRIEKGALFWRSPRRAIRFINRDDTNILKIPYLPDWPTLSFATEENAEVKGSPPVPMGLKGTRFTLSAREEHIEIILPLPGVHHVRNAVAAAAIGISEGVSVSDIKTALESFKATEGRLEPIFTSSSCIVLNDTYNANPVATAMAIRTLATFNLSHTTVAILGDMLELGESSETYHEKIGAECARQGIHLLGLTGTYCDAIRSGAIENGFDKDRIFTFENARQLLQHLGPYLQQPSVILVKGSFALNMSQWVKVILSAFDTEEGHV